MTAPRPRRFTAEELQAAAAKYRQEHWCPRCKDCSLGAITNDDGDVWHCIECNYTGDLCHAEPFEIAEKLQQAAEDARRLEKIQAWLESGEIPNTVGALASGGWIRARREVRALLQGE